MCVTVWAEILDSGSMLRADESFFVFFAGLRQYSLALENLFFPVA
jgi:hypothetical protein